MDHGKHLIYAIVMAGGMLGGYSSKAAGAHVASKHFVETFYPDVSSQPPYVAAFNLCPYSKQVLQAYVSRTFISQLLGFHLFAWKGALTSTKLVWSCILLAFGMAIIALVNQPTFFSFGMFSIGCGVGIAMQAIPLIIVEFAPLASKEMMRATFGLAYVLGVLYSDLYNLLPWRSYTPVVGYLLPCLVFCCAAINFIRIAHCLQSRRASPTHFRIHRRQLALSGSIQLFLQLTGIDALVIYVPVILLSMGHRDDTSRVVSFLTSLLTFGAVMVFTFMRRNNSRSNAALFGLGCLFIVICQIVISFIMIQGSPPDTFLPEYGAYTAMTFAVLFYVSYAGMAGPLGFITVPFEEEIRVTVDLVNWTCIWLASILMKHIFNPLSCWVEGGLLIIFLFITLPVGMSILQQYQCL